MRMGTPLASRRARRAAGRDPAGEGRRGDRRDRRRVPGSLPATLDIASGNVPSSGGRARQPGPGHAAGRRTGSSAGTGTVQSDRYPAVVRPRRPVTVSGAGHLLDGLWYVQGVRHRWGVDPADPEREQRIRRYEADVTVVRNALGGAA